MFFNGNTFDFDKSISCLVASFFCKAVDDGPPLPCGVGGIKNLHGGAENKKEERHVQVNKCSFISNNLF